MLKTGVKGAIVGGLMGGLGAAGGAALKAGKAALMSGGGLKAAAQAGGKAAAAESRAIAQGAKNLFKKGCSFTADTKVQMADGKQKPIKDVKVGDTVQATDPRTGKASPRTVLAVKVNRDNALTDLTVKTPNGTVTTIRTSQNHPFWDSDQQVWVSAGDLRSGTEQYGSAGTSSEIVDVRNYLGTRDMYDLTVAETHTYYVIAGTTPVLVHNCVGEIRQDIIDETADHATQFLNRTSKKFSASFISKFSITMDDAMATGRAFVGDAAKEVAPGVFRNGNKGFRVDPASVQGIGHWPNSPHVHFEIFDDLGKSIANNHVPLIG
ncbi:Hint domain-containing protein [Dactylosporangium sp. NPDC051484]|uniref:Hint domain-containing protein n=1 Tax=Dactylosporangium sp. NPDC051484 TaxID=3154942 RepID=UPI00345000E9